MIRIVLFDLLLIVGVYMSRRAFAGKPFEVAFYAVFAELEYPINLTEHKGGAALCPLCASILYYAHKEQCLCCGCRFDRNITL